MGVNQPRLLLVAAAVLFSTGGAAIKGTLLTAAQVAGLRSLIAAAIILLILPDARKWRRRYVPVAITYAATLALFVAATKLTTAANAIYLQGSAPLFVLLLGPLLLREPIRRSDVVFMAAVGFGMALFFTAGEPVRESAPDPVRGNMLGAASALTWALTLTGLRWIERSAPRGESPGMATVTMGNLMVGAAMLPFALPIVNFQVKDVFVIAWLGLFQIALAYLCLTRGIGSVPALEATTILLLEPALNPVWAWLIHSERPSAQAIAGGAVIVTATLIKAWWQTQRVPST